MMQACCRTVLFLSTSISLTAIPAIVPEEYALPNSLHAMEWLIECSGQIELHARTTIGRPCMQSATQKDHQQQLEVSFKGGTHRKT
jgi:hypothetical protein